MIKYYIEILWFFYYFGRISYWGKWEGRISKQIFLFAPEKNTKLHFLTRKNGMDLKDNEKDS